MSAPARDRNGWRIRWIDSSGKRRSETYSDITDAKFALQRHELEAEQVRRGLRAASSVHTFADLLAHWRKHRAPGKRSANDDESLFKCHLIPAFGRLTLQEITTDKVVEFSTKFPRSKKTLHNTLTLLVSLLNEAQALKWIREEEKPTIRKPRLPKSTDYVYLETADEIRRFLAAALEEGRSVHALYATAVYTGMRAGELAALRWSRIDFGKRLIKVSASFDGPTKADDVRFVPILDALMPVLEDWKEQDDDGARIVRPRDVVFPNTAGNMQVEAADIFQAIFHRVLQRAELEVEGEDRLPNGRHRIVFHALRHTFASHWVMGSGDLYRLQKIGGWRSYEMVSRYSHLAPAAYEADYGRLGPATLPSSGGDVVKLAR